jgi:hypothetical protein
MEVIAMARKRKSPTGELKTKTIRVCVTEAEYYAIQARARSFSMSEYLLKCGLGESIPPQRRHPSVPEVNRLTYIELGKIAAAVEHIASQSESSLNEVEWRSWQNQIDAVRLQLIGVDVNQFDEGDEEL